MTGARTALGGPRDDLTLAYRGTAYFLRLLTQLPERAYDEPGHPAAQQDRRTTIATVGVDARRWANLVESVRTRRRDAVTLTAGDRHAAISSSATLPPHALRHLVEHSAAHLAVEWRDLPPADWSAEGRDETSTPLPVSRLPWLRARQTWLAAIDLGSGGRFADLPPALTDRLVTEQEASMISNGDDHRQFASAAATSGVRTMPSPANAQLSSVKEQL